MEIIKSRHNKLAVHMKKLGTDSEYRRQCGEYLCQGRKLYLEALAAGAEIRRVLAAAGEGDMPQGAEAADRELMEYISPMKSAPELLFTCAERQNAKGMRGRIILLENMQDPGNVGTIMRTAKAFGMDGMILAGQCADPYNPKSVRASMGAVFSMDVFRAETAEGFNLPLYAAALSDDAESAEDAEFADEFILAIGNEGHGLSHELISRADKVIKIPMEKGSESLNAAAAAAVLMWKAWTDRRREGRADDAGKR